MKSTVKLKPRVSARIDREIKNDRPLERIRKDLEKNGIVVTRWYLSKRKEELFPQKKEPIQARLDFDGNPITVGSYIPCRSSTKDHLKACIENMDSQLQMLRKLVEEI
jgi:hypothetical protein